MGYKFNLKRAVKEFHADFPDHRAQTIFIDLTHMNPISRFCKLFKADVHLGKHHPDLDIKGRDKITHDLGKVLENSRGYPCVVPINLYLYEQGFEIIDPNIIQNVLCLETTIQFTNFAENFIGPHAKKLSQKANDPHLNNKLHQFVFDHESAHVLTRGLFSNPDASKLEHFMENESISDSYAALRHLQRTGDFKFVKMWLALRTVAAICNKDISHYTAPAILASIEYAQKNDLSNLTAQDLIDIAIGIGSHPNNKIKLDECFYENYQAVKIKKSLGDRDLLSDPLAWTGFVKNLTYNPSPQLRELAQNWFCALNHLGIRTPEMQSAPISSQKSLTDVWQEKSCESQFVVPNFPQKQKISKP